MKEGFLPSYTQLSKEELVSTLQKPFVGYSGDSKPILDFMLDICELHEDIIYWKDISEIITHYFLMSEISELIKGLQRLENAQYLVMRNDAGIDGVEPTYIRLTEPNSTLFMCEWITEQLVQASVTLSLPLSFEKEISKTKFKIPYDDIIPFTDIAVKYKVEIIPDLYAPKIFSLDLHTAMLYFTSFSITFLDKLVINKLANVVNSAGSDIFTIVTKIYNVSQMDLIQSIREYNLSDLLQFTQAIHRNYKSLAKSPIMQRHSSFLELSLTLANILPISIQLNEQMKKQSANTKQLESIIEENVTRKKVYTKFQFESLLDTIFEEIYGNNPNEINYRKDSYIAEHIVPAQAVTSMDIDTLIDFNTYYIHSSHIVDLLINDYLTIRAKVVGMISAEIKTFLYGKLQLKNACFYDKESIKTAIKRCLFKDFPAYYSITKFPPLMWLAFNSISDSDFSGYTKQIARYFSINTKKLLPWLDIFKISIRGLYLEVSKNLGIFGRIVISLKGTKSKFLQHINKELKASGE